MKLIPKDEVYYPGFADIHDRLAELCLRYTQHGWPSREIKFAAERLREGAGSLARNQDPPPFLKANS